MGYHKNRETPPPKPAPDPRLIKQQADRLGVETTTSIAEATTQIQGGHERYLGTTASAGEQRGK